MIAPLGHQGAQVLAGQGEALGGPRQGRQWLTPEGPIDAAHQPGGPHGRPTQHHSIGPGSGKACQGRFRAGDVAVEHRGERLRHLFMAFRLLLGDFSLEQPLRSPAPSPPTRR